MRLSKLFIVLTEVAVNCSCATIVSRSSYPVDFSSDPQGAQLTIQNRDGFVVFEGKTPTTVYLNSSAGYMRREIYRVTYQHPGQEPVTTIIEAELDGWYFGNILLGGLIGMLIVDPLTGAMYKIPPRSHSVGSGREAHSIPIRRLPDESSTPSPPSPPSPPPADTIETGGNQEAGNQWLPLGD